MKKKMLSLLSLITVLVSSGCAIHIGELPVTARDDEKFNNIYLDEHKICKDKNLPSTIVMRTKGSGRVAEINMGYDDCLREGNRVDFYNVIYKGNQRLLHTFASGRVIVIHPKTAWVEVENYKTAGVRENNFAGVALIQKKKLEEVADPTTWISTK